MSDFCSTSNGSAIISKLICPYHLNSCTFLRQVIPSSGKNIALLKNIIMYLTCSQHCLWLLTLDLLHLRESDSIVCSFMFLLPLQIPVYACEPKKLQFFRTHSRSQSKENGFKTKDFCTLFTPFLCQKLIVSVLL